MWPTRMPCRWDFFRRRVASRRFRSSLDDFILARPDVTRPTGETDLGSTDADQAQALTSRSTNDNFQLSSSSKVSHSSLNRLQQDSLLVLPKDQHRSKSNLFRNNNKLSSALLLSLPSLPLSLRPTKPQAKTKRDLSNSPSSPHTHQSTLPFLSSPSRTSPSTQES